MNFFLHVPCHCEDCTGFDFWIHKAGIAGHLDEALQVYAWRKNIFYSYLLNEKSTRMPVEKTSPHDARNVEEERLKSQNEWHLNKGLFEIGQ